MPTISTAVLHPPPDRFPPGTVVGAYRANAWSSRDHTVPPTGPADTTATVAADGSLTFSGLTDQAGYLAYAAGSGAPVVFSTRHDRVDDVSSALVAPSTSTKMKPGILGNRGLVAEHNHHSGPGNLISFAQHNSRLRHKLLADVVDVQFLYPNWSAGEASGVASIDVWSALEIAATGTVVPLTFDGAAKRTIDPDGFALTDPMPIDQLSGVILWSRTHAETLGASIPSNRRSQFALGEGGASVASGQANAALAGAAAVSASTNTSCYGPSAVIGTLRDGTTRIWVAVVGDSIADGTGDNLGGVQDRGFIARALERDGIPFLQVTKPGETAATYAAIANSRRRRQLSSGSDFVYSQHATNDIAFGATLAVTQAAMVAIWQAYANRGSKVITQTTTPKSTSTDGFTTLANQTVDATNPVRVLYNNWIRDGSPIDATTKVAVATGTTTNVLRAGQSGHPLYANGAAPKGYVEIADVVESARDSGKWKVPGSTGVGDLNTSTSVTNYSGNLAVGQTIVGTGIVAGTKISSIVGATLTMDAAATATTAGVALAGGYTPEGVHPSIALHDQMMAAIPTGLFV